MLTQNDLEKSEISRRLLIVAALMPPPISLDTVTEVVGCPPVAALHSLEDLAKQGVLSPYSPAGMGFYQFRDSGRVPALLECEDRELVKQLASAYISHTAEKHDSELNGALAIANAYYLSGLPVTQFEPLLQAADYCLRQGAREAAAIYYRMALEAREQSVNSRRDKEELVASALGMVAANGHRMPLGLQANTLQKARDLAQQLSDQDNLCKILLWLGRIHKLQGSYQSAGQLFEDAWCLALQLDRQDILKTAALFSSDFLFWQGRVATAVARYEEVIGDLEEFPSDEAVLCACTTLGWCYSICGQTARGLGLNEAVRQKARALGFKQAEMDSYVMSVLTMIDAGYYGQAETLLKEIFKFSEEDLGNYRLWASYAARGFILYTKGDLKGCFQYQQKAYAKSKEVGWPHHRGPYNFEYMAALEDAGMVHPEMNYESELRRVASWPDIYMQGVGLRYEAIRMQKNHQPRAEILDRLERSQALLTQAGAELELAHTRIELAKLKLGGQDEPLAQKLLQRAWEVLSTINEDLFPYALRPYLETEPAEERIIRVMTDLGTAVGTVHDREKLLERVINLLMKLTLAGRGGYFTFGPEGRPQLSASRNLDQALVDSPDFGAGLDSVVNAFNGSDQQLEAPAGFSDKMPWRKQCEGWILCRRVSHRGRLLGVIYLDNTLVDMTPPAKILTFLDLIISYVAVALDNARAFEEVNAFKEKLEDETRLYRQGFQCAANTGHMIGRSPAISKVMEQIHKVAPSDTTVLIHGETGVGKEMVAHAIHKMSLRRDGPFIAVDIASLDPGVGASELFGHERGAFSGAVKSRRGRFELADRGTLFLDDVDNLSLEIQAKLLRALQEKEFQRVGGNKVIHSDFRLIAATNRNLDELVEKGAFRADLFFRINVFPIKVPPLRDRPEDLPLLATYFMDKFSVKMGKQIKGISKKDMRRLEQYPWPGNIRELKHVIERGVILTEGEMLVVAELESGGAMGDQTAGFPTMQEMERGHILEALSLCQWRVSGKGGAAELLGLKPTTLFSKLKKHGISKKTSFS